MWLKWWALLRHLAGRRSPVVVSFTCPCIVGAVGRALIRQLTCAAALNEYFAADA